MLVSAREMLQKAKAEGYAVAQININNLEWIKAVLSTVEELKSPVILGVSEGAAKYMGGYENVMAMVSTLDKAMNITVPVAVHLDHGSYEGAFKAIRAGFTSVMFDGSHYPFEENLKKTKEVVAVAHAVGVSVEAEVGRSEEHTSELQSRPHLVCRLLLEKKKKKILKAESIKHNDST